MRNSLSLSRKPLRWPDPAVEGFDLEIDSGRDGAPTGDAQIIFRPLDFFAPEVVEIAAELGIQPDAPILHLNEFYPNGRRADEGDAPWTRGGIGGEVFEKILETARERGCRGIYAFSGKGSMKNFCEKRGFFPVSAEGDRWFLPITA